MNRPDMTSKVVCGSDGGAALAELNRHAALNALDPEMNVRPFDLWAEPLLSAEDTRQSGRAFAERRTAVFTGR